MNDLDKIASQLAAAGFYLGLKRRRDDWECTLWNGEMTPHYLPVGVAKTYAGAVEAAIAARDKAITDGRSKMK